MGPAWNKFHAGPFFIAGGSLFYSSCEKGVAVVEGVFMDFFRLFLRNDV